MSEETNEMPTISINEDGEKIEILIENVMSLVLTDGTGSSNSCDTCNRSGDTLTDLQRSVFHQVHTSINGKTNQVILIDSPSGTGKSYLLSQLASQYARNKLHYVVFRKDQSSELYLRNIRSFTFLAYNMRSFNMDYHDAIRMFTMDRTYHIEALYILLQYASKYSFSRKEVEVIILDAYTMVSPFMLLLIYIISLKNNITLIFAGNKLQLGTINRPRMHKKNNFHILNILSDQMISEMTNVRSTDSEFLDKLSRFREILSTQITNGDAPFYFNLRYALYQMFTDKYDPAIADDIHCVYMSPIHQYITSRMYRLMDSLDPKDYHVEPFPGVPFTKTVDKNKFFPGLLLVKGCKYLYVTPQGVNHIVELVELIYANGTLMELDVLLENGTIVSLKRCILNFYQILPAYRRWLESRMRTMNKLIIQFPLRPYVLTYHAALGRTINDSVELETDCSRASSIYVGLSCVSSESSIRKFHAKKDYLSFLATQHMENIDDKMYYYRIPTTGNVEGSVPPELEEYVTREESGDVKWCFEKIEWVTMNSIKAFENATELVRIKREMYETVKTEKEEAIEPTVLMQFTKFVKENQGLILNILSKLPKHTACYARPASYYQNISTFKTLSDAFEDWKINNAERTPE